MVILPIIHLQNSNMSKITALDNARIANCREEWQGELESGTLLFDSEKILWFGLPERIPESFKEHISHHIDLDNRIITPGFIDCHTHLVYGGDRANEFARRLQGASYEQIAQEGGGIISTVNATREASKEELTESAKQRIHYWITSGFTTIEIKSGYGLNGDVEIKMLQVIDELKHKMPINIVATLLAAHTVPEEYLNKGDAYIQWIMDELMPVVASKNLAQAVDVFCESIGFSNEQSRKMLTAASELGFKLKIHAEQLSDTQGAGMAARLGAISADHLEYLSEDSVKVMQSSGTVAVLLPAAYYFLRETQLPPIELLRRYQVPIALGSDSNPGSAPILSPLLILNMATTLFKMTTLEAIKGVTIHAAKALGLENNSGSIEIGKKPDFAIWSVQNLEELCYWIGGNPCYGRIIDGHYLKN